MVGTTATPYLRASSGRSCQSRQSEHSGCVNSTIPPALPSATSAGSMRGTRRAETPRRRAENRYISQPRQSPVTAASSASAPTIPVSTHPTAAASRTKASVAAPRKPAPIMLAKRGGRASSIGPSPKRGCSSSKYRRQGRQKRRPNARPTTSWSASTATSHSAPATIASSETPPITAWFVRGARASITSRSSYGCAVLPVMASAIMARRSRVSAEGRHPYPPLPNPHGGDHRRLRDRLLRVRAGTLEPRRQGQRTSDRVRGDPVRDLTSGGRVRRGHERADRLRGPAGCHRPGPRSGALVGHRLHLDVHAREPASPGREHALPLDLRQQHRGLDEPLAVLCLLPARRRGGPAGPGADRYGLHGPDGPRQWRD